MWNDINQLKNLSTWLQWTSIVLIFVSGILQFTKYKIDLQKDYLIGIELSPAHQKISTMTASLTVYDATNGTLFGNFKDDFNYRAVYITLFGDKKPIVELRTREYSANTLNHEIVWRANLALDSSDPINGMPVSVLENARYIKIRFYNPWPLKVRSGQLVMVINSMIRFEMEIPPQEAADGEVIVRDLSGLTARLEK